MPASAPRLFTIAAYPRKLLRLCEQQWQIAPAELLKATQLQPEQLARPELLVPLQDVFALFVRAQQLTAAPDLALRYAQCLPPSTHGLLGTATLTAATLHDVIDLYYEYMATVAPFVLMHQTERRDQLTLVLELFDDLPMDEAFVMTLLLATAFNICEGILGEEAERSMIMRQSRSLVSCGSITSFRETRSPYVAWSPSKRSIGVGVIASTSANSSSLPPK